MTKYNCFSCGKNIKEEYLKKRIRCPYCGSKILYKARTTTTELKAI
ncbi:DNA-directed RNA polymerase subunit P [Candidatus Woesearchaeota archaeon]|nr:DNA-directed RNA polymerase subunit P [Candidatus Woesearchaeota archaeon]